MVEFSPEQYWSIVEVRDAYPIVFRDMWSRRSWKVLGNVPCLSFWNEIRTASVFLGLMWIPTSRSALDMARLASSHFFFIASLACLLEAYTYISSAYAAIWTPGSFMLSTWAVYKKNSTNPWGTPHVKFLREDRLPPTLAEKVLPRRYSFTISTILT